MRFLNLGICLCFIVGSLCGQVDKTELHPKEKTEVIKGILDQHFIDYPDVIRPGKVLFSTNLIDGFNKYERKGYEFVFLKYDEIAKMAKREGAEYVGFTKLYRRQEKVIAEIDSFFLGVIDGEVEPLYGSTCRWEGEKKSGRWVFECVETSSFIVTAVRDGAGRVP